MLRDSARARSRSRRHPSPDRPASASLRPRYRCKPRVAPEKRPSVSRPPCAHALPVDSAVMPIISRMRAALGAVVCESRSRRRALARSHRRLPLPRIEDAKRARDQRRHPAVLSSAPRHRLPLSTARPPSREIVRPPGTRGRDRPRRHFLAACGGKFPRRRADTRPARAQDHARAAYI